MDLDRILSELKAERNQLDQAIRALEGVRPGGADAKPKGTSTVAPGAKRKRRGLTPEGRRRLSDLMKKRWAARKSKARGTPAVSGPMKATKNPSGGMSAAARRRLSEAMKKRWAERRRAAAKAAS